ICVFAKLWALPVLRFYCNLLARLNCAAGSDMKTAVFLLSLILVISCQCSAEHDNTSGITGNNPAQVYPEVLSVIPHDSTAFTQGLFFHDGKLYESTGLYNQSSLRILDTLGTVLKKTDVPQVFAEGIALFENNLFQLTWQNQFAIVYTFPDLKSKGTVSYKGEGWGLTNNKSSLIMSNGTDTLYFMNSRFEINKRLAVTCKGKPLTNLNELEYASGKIYANVWYNDYIFEISPQSGAAVRIIDCSQIVAREKPSSDECVLNGIACADSQNTFYITGKNWKHIYKIKID
ncbi:MAG: glutaminyl-peptide cyclotransferase, partial [Fibrobacter sp.]|nr:glutaminyl-peptide cyclotransferase [Fibrobacter sp.]